jgi:hypothetical protein
MTLSLKLTKQKNQINPNCSYFRDKILDFFLDFKSQAVLLFFHIQQFKDEQTATVFP